MIFDSAISNGPRSYEAPSNGGIEALTNAARSAWDVQAQYAGARLRKPMSIGSGCPSASPISDRASLHCPSWLAWLSVPGDAIPSAEGTVLVLAVCAGFG
jgi:hypothetical protein